MKEGDQKVGNSGGWTLKSKELHNCISCKTRYLWAKQRYWKDELDERDMINEGIEESGWVVEMGDIWMIGEVGELESERNWKDSRNDIVWM